MPAVFFVFQANTDAGYLSKLHPETKLLLFCQNSTPKNVKSAFLSDPLSGADARLLILNY